MMAPLIQAQKPNLLVTLILVFTKSNGFLFEILEVKYIYIWSSLWHLAVFEFTEEGYIKETYFSCKPQQGRSLGFLI